MPSRTILHYQLIERIGGGGMGDVWKALDTRLDREVALKFLPEHDVSDPTRRERFIREAKAASALNHPNIVTIYEINSDSGHLFIAMELVRGRALSEVLEAQGRLAPGVAVDYTIQLCAGLGAAHRAGIVHRDIKPSNIMLADTGIIKILDFGLAKLTSPETDGGGRTRTTPAPITVAGTVVGTVSYMSPEQAAGDAVDARSDVFSTGVVLYEMLSGRRPFEGASNTEIMRALLSDDPAPLLSSTADLPEALERITVKCLQKKPSGRYGDAAELGSALRALDSGSWPRPLFELTTVSLNTQGRALRNGQKRRNLIVAAALVMLAGGLSGGYVWRRFKDGGLPRPAASTLAPSDALQRAQAYLQRYDRKGNVDRAIATLEPVLERDRSNAALHAALAEAYVRKHGENRDTRWLQKAVEAGRHAVAANHDLAVGHAALGMALAASGQNTEAAVAFQRALELNPLSGPAHLGLARLRSGQEAEQLYQAAVRLSPGEWAPLHLMGAFYYRNARYEDSLEAWRRALHLTPDNVLVMVYIGAVLHMQDKWAEAADIFQRALALDPTTAETWANLGTARYYEGRYLDSVRAFEKAVELAPGRYLYWGNLGDSYHRIDGSSGKALEAYQKAIRLAREQLAVSSNERVRSSLALYLARAGDSSGALAEIAMLEQAGEKDQGTSFKTALVYELVNQREKALAALGRAIQAGYSMHEIANEPELAALRSDPRYAKIAGRAAQAKKSR